MYNMVNKSCLFIIDTLYNQSVYCIILFVLIFSLSFLLKKKSPRWQLGLWLLILIRLVLPTDLYLSFSARNLADNFIVNNNFNIPVKIISDKVDIIERINQLSALYPSRALEGVKSDTQALAASKEENKISISLPVILTIIWVLGCLIFMALFISKISGINRVLKNSLRVQDREILAITDYWRQNFKVKRSVSIFSSDNFLSPFTAGIFRPKIFIPVPLLKNRNNETINSIIAHEMVHIKRLDHMWIRLQNLLQVIYFFNPIIWYANTQINIARERVCDSVVLDKKIISPGAFGKSVIDALKINVYGRPLFDSVSGFSSHKKIIEYRIKDILREDTVSKQRTSFIFIMICLLGLFLLPMSRGNTVTDKPEIKIEEKVVEPVITIIEKNLEMGKIIRSSLKNEIQNEEHIVVSSVKDIPVPAIPFEAVEKVNQTLMTDNRSTSGPAANPEVKKETLILPKKHKSEDLPEKDIPVPESDKTEKNINASGAAQERDIRMVTHANRGYACLRKDQFENAISEFSKAIDLNPGATLCYFGRGQAYMATNQVDNAISDFTRTIELIPITFLLISTVDLYIVF